MPKVGPIMTIPGGSYCYVTLDLGQRLVVAHHLGDRAAGAGPPRFTVERLTLMGFSSEPVFQLDLTGREGQGILDALARAHPPESTSPLRAFVAHIAGCGSLAEVHTRCRELLQHHAHPDVCA